MIQPSLSLWLLWHPSLLPTDIEKLAPLTAPPLHPPSLPLPVLRLLSLQSNPRLCWARQWLSRRKSASQWTEPGLQGVLEAGVMHRTLYTLNVCQLTLANVFCWTPSRTWWWKLSEESCSSQRRPAPLRCHLFPPGEDRQTFYTDTHTFSNSASVNSFLYLLT